MISVSGGRRGGAATNGGRDAVGSGRGAAPDAVDASTSSEPIRRPGRQLAVVSDRLDGNAPRRREKLRTDIHFPRRGLDLSRFLPADAYAVYDLFGVINHLVRTRRPFPSIASS